MAYYINEAAAVKLAQDYVLNEYGWMPKAPEAVLPPDRSMDRREFEVSFFNRGNQVVIQVSQSGKDVYDMTDIDSGLDEADLLAIREDLVPLGF